MVGANYDITSNHLTITVSEPPKEFSSTSLNNKEVASLFINNKEVQSIVRVSDNVVLYEKPTIVKEPTTLTLSASSNSIYVGESPVLTGNLSIGEGKTVKLYKGDSLLTTLTTTANGNFSYTDTATSSSGTLTYKAVYEGEILYESSESGTVSISINKKQPSITMSVSPSSVIVGGTVTITGQLSYQNVGIPNAMIYLSENNSTDKRTTTDSNGNYTFSITISDTTSLIVMYLGDTEYKSTTRSQSITPITPSVSTVSLTEANNKSAISAYTSETAVFTATALDSSNNPVSGVAMTIKVDGTTVKTEATDSNGQVSYTYTAVGTGDVTISAECMSVIETYEIEDCDYTIIPDTVVAPTSGDINFYSYNVESDFILTADYYPVNTWEWFWLRDTSSNKNIGVFSSSYDKGSYFGITNLGYNGWKSITIKLENNTLTFNYGNTTVSTDVSDYIPGTWKFFVNRKNTRFKNLKIKKL